MAKRNTIWRRGLSAALSVTMAGTLVLQAVQPIPVQAADHTTINNNSLTVKIGDLGQISSLTINNDKLNNHGEQIEFVLPNDTNPQNDTDHQWMGEMIFSTRTSSDGSFPSDNSGFVEVDTNRTLAAGGSTTATDINADNPYIQKTVEDNKVTVQFTGESLDSQLEGVIKGFDVTSVFDMNTTDGSMLWSITLKNTSDQYIEFGDIGLPMPWNNKYRDIDDTYSNRLTVHSFAGADSGYMYAIRTSGEGNYMLFSPVPDSGARIEYVDYWLGNGYLGPDYRAENTNWVGDGGGWYPGLSVCYIHSKDIWEKTGRSYLAEDPTSLVLEPQGEKTYQFKFSAVRAGDNTPGDSSQHENNASLSVEERENNLRSILYDSGLIDAVAVPGFQTALNMETKLDLHYDDSRITNVQVDIQCVHENDPYDEEHIPTQLEGGVSNDRGGMGEHGATGYSESCNLVETKEVDGEQHHIYDLSFGCIGNNSVCVSYELDGAPKYTQYEFNVLAELDDLTETHSDFVVNETQDQDPDSPTYGIYSDWYIGAETTNDSHWGDDWSHDNIDFMVMKNYLDPDPAEIQSIETYLIDFMWENYMKYSHESFAVANYLRDSGIYADSEQPYSRTFSEIMVVTAYFNMYRIIKAYPDLMEYREPAEYYLQKAYDIYTNRVDTGAIGFYGEQQIPQMIEALWTEGMTEEAQALQQQFALEKGTNVANAAYPYGSEFEYDNTGEEGAYAAAKALRTYYPQSAQVQDALEGMGLANMKTRAMRGMQPAWFFYADPVFRGGEGWWNFQYTASLAGYIMDDWMRYETDGQTDSTGWAARMNYAAKLSNFNAVNMGQISDKSIGSVAWRFNAYKGGYGTKNVNDGNENGVGTMRNGWNDFAGESDLGLYGSLLTISSDVVTDPVFGLYGYGCTVQKSGSTYTVTPTDGFGKRINLLDEKLYLELVQDVCTTAQIAADGSSMTLSLTSSDQQNDHTTQINFSGAGLADGYYSISVNGTPSGQMLVTDHSGTAYASIPAGAGSTVTLTKLSGGDNQAPQVSVSCDEETVQAIAPFTVRSTATDDGSANRLTYTWSVETKPEGADVTFANPNRAYTEVTVTQEGQYVLVLTVSDGTLETTAKLNLNIEPAPERQPPVITKATATQNPTNVSTADLAAEAEADSLYQGTLTYAWSLAGQPEGSNAVIAGADQQNAVLLVDQPGSYAVKLTVTDADKVSEQTLTVEMDASADGVQRGPIVVTQVETAPVLPETMEVILADGSTTEVPVVWETVPEDAYQKQGEFEVQGDADGIHVACKVMVVTGERQNLALAATPTAIIDTPQDLGGVAGLNDGYEPAGSSDTSHGVWHNWLGDQNSAAWVQYTWENPVVIDGTDAYYFKDGSGNFAPKSVYYEYLEGDTWKPLPNAQGMGLKLNQYNTTTFDPVETTAIRMTMTPATKGCGVIEWKVYGYGSYADRSVLRAALDAAKAINPDLLEAESVAALQQAIAAAQAVYDNQDAQQKEINDAASTLNRAVGNLKPKGGNLAYTVSADTSFVSGWESLEAVNDGIVNMGVNPASPRYGTWGNESAYETITYTWPVAMNLTGTEIQFWTDEGGIQPPAGYAFYQLDENGQYTLITERSGVAPTDTMLWTALDGVTTTSLRIRIDKQVADGNGIGVMEWRVFGEAAPQIPEEKTYTITVIQSAGGTISPATTEVKEGTDQTFTITAGAGYVLKDVLVDGQSAGAMSAYTFSNVTEDHTITAIFEAVSGGGDGGDSGDSGNSGGSGSSGGSDTTTGDKTVTEILPDGSVVTTVIKPDGTKTETIKAPNGSSSVVTTDPDGKVDAQVKLPGSVIDSAEQNGELVKLPLPDLTATGEPDNAPTVTVTMPNGSTAKVEIPVATPSSGVVAVLVKPDGTREVIKQSIATENGIAVMLQNGDTVQLVDNTKVFRDVPAEFWGADAIGFVTSRELFGGTGENIFSPDANMSRAMMVTVLARLEGVDTTDGSVWYEAGREWAMEAGISDGSNMEGSLTREQLAAMLYRYAEYKGCRMDREDAALEAFADAETVSDWAEEPMSWATTAGILTGTNGALKPQGNATRAQVAAMLQRYMEYYFFNGSADKAE